MECLENEIASAKTGSPGGMLRDRKSDQLMRTQDGYLMKIRENLVTRNPNNLQ